MSDVSFYDATKVSRDDNDTLSNSKNHLKVPNIGVPEKANPPFQRMKSNSIAVPSICTCLHPLRNSQKDSSKITEMIPAEKSSLILVAIVLLFILTHSYRLALKVYEVLMPQGNTFENFKRCFSIGR